MEREKFNRKAKSIEKYINYKFNTLNSNHASFNMKLKGVGGIQKIYFDLDKVTHQFTNQNSFRKSC